MPIVLSYKRKSLQKKKFAIMPLNVTHAVLPHLGAIALDKQDSQTLSCYFFYTLFTHSLVRNESSNTMFYGFIHFQPFSCCKMVAECYYGFQYRTDRMFYSWPRQFEWLSCHAVSAKSFWFSCRIISKIKLKKPCRSFPQTIEIVLSFAVVSMQVLED